MMMLQGLTVSEGLPLAGQTVNEDRSDVQCSACGPKIEAK